MAIKFGDAPERPRRFYTRAEARGLEVHLDGKALRTPGRAPLLLPTEAAAQMVADEWEAQVDTIDLSVMPATRHAFTAIDRVPGARQEVVHEISRFAGSDLLCYFAEQPRALVERQAQAWSPLLNWAEDELGLVFKPTEGVNPQAQPPETLARIEFLASEMDNFRLSASAFGAALFGSAILALAVERGRLDAGAAYELSRLDEAFQEEQWGTDEEAAERTAAQRTEALVLGQWLIALA